MPSLRCNLLVHCGSPQGRKRPRMDRRTINLPKSGRKVLGTNLNRSEASGALPLSCQPQETGGEPQHTQGKLRIGRPLRQVFMAGQDDESVAAPTFLRGLVTHNGRGPLRITGGQERGRKNARFDAVSGTCSCWKTRGVRRGVLVFREGVALLPGGLRTAPGLPEASRPRSIRRPFASTHPA